VTGWQQSPATAILILADGTRIEGRGLGAVGHAAGEVCFNTAMTGYQEILTDPSYAGQIITFTFPHIGNVGTNDEDIETVNMAALSGIRGCVLRADVTSPSNWRAGERLDAWLRKRNIIGIAGVDTRALTARIRENGMPNGVIAHSPDGYFHEPSMLAELRNFPGLEGLDLAKEVTTAQTYQWDQTPWTWGDGYGTLTQPDFHVVAVDYGAKRNILRQLAEQGARVTVVPATASARDILAHNPDAVFLSNCHGEIRGAHDPRADRNRQADVRHLPRPPVARAGARRPHREDAPGPPRGQPPGQGPHHRQGRDHLDEPRLCGGFGEPAGRRHPDACFAVRRFQCRPVGRRQADIFGPVSPGSLAGPAG
jgi:carbamoyl-phosphate synthase small subunit